MTLNEELYNPLQERIDDLEKHIDRIEATVQVVEGNFETWADKAFHGIAEKADDFSRANSKLFRQIMAYLVGIVILFGTWEVLNSRNLATHQTNLQIKVNDSIQKLSEKMTEYTEKQIEVTTIQKRVLQDSRSDSETINELIKNHYELKARVSAMEKQ